jgi:hypothetical protein
MTNFSTRIIQLFEENRFGFIAPIAVTVVALGSIAASCALFQNQLIALGLITVSCILCETLIIAQCSMKSIFWSAVIACAICVLVLITAAL